MVGAVHGEGDGVVVYHHMRLAVGLGDPTAGANTVREEIENQFLFEEQGEGDHTDYVMVLAFRRHLRLGRSGECAVGK